jgi:glycosyltransferase involved in cell wall biosynthesis
MPLISTIIPVFRDRERALATVQALLRCRLSATDTLEVLVVDDASQDGTAEALAEHLGERVTLLENPHNLGRAATRNRGARAAAGELLLFLDCDCQPLDEHFLQHHLARLREVDVSIGAVRGDGQGFWHAYQERAAQRRAQRSDQTIALQFTSANVMLKRDRFEAAGGFDERYRGYGFEDRALALRLQHDGATLRLSPLALTCHHDQLDLPTVCVKMHAAARGNATIFSHAFAEAYRQLGYAAIDARLHPWLRPLSHALEPLRNPLIRWLDRRLENAALPFAWRAAAVRALVATSYLRGSVEAAAASSTAR